MVHFGNKSVGDGNPCFIVFEAGPTHNGLDTAKRLAKLAAEAGADAVKFQLIDPDRLVADKNMLFTYDVLLDRESGKTETIKEPLYDILCRRTLAISEWYQLKTYCDFLGLAFFATIGFDDELELLQKLGCDSVKIASSDVNHWPLIRQAARTGMCLQLDTGNATIGEIESAIDVAFREGNRNIIVHQCPSGYPARLDSINLRVITTLKKMFELPVAYSDHTPGYNMDIAAVALGANLVEKTITMDRMTRSVEHLFSLESHEISAFVKVIRETELAMGSPRRFMQSQEIENRLNNRRSVHLKHGGSKGQRLDEIDIEFRRPGIGIGPDMYESLSSFRLSRDLDPGRRLEYSDIE